MITFIILSIGIYLIYAWAKKNSKPKVIEKPQDLQKFSMAMTGVPYHFQYDNNNPSCLVCTLVNKDCPLTFKDNYRVHCKQSLGSFLDILE